MTSPIEPFAKNLTEEEETKVQELAAAVAATVKVRGSERARQRGAPATPPHIHTCILPFTLPPLQSSPAHLAFCTTGTYVRYLRARGWTVHKAVRMLEETLKWRASYKPEELTFESLRAEAQRGKVFVLDHPDLEGRPAVFMRPRKEVYGGNNDDRLKWVVYVMEQASRLADAACE